MAEAVIPPQTPVKKEATKSSKPKTQSKTTAPLKKDGTPDKRYKENKHLKKDGTPDKRYGKRTKKH